MLPEDKHAYAHSIREEFWSTPTLYKYEQPYYKLGTHLRKKLSLSNENVLWLNSFMNTSSFRGVSQSYEYTIVSLYLFLCKRMDSGAFSEREDFRTYLIEKALSRLGKSRISNTDERKRVISTLRNDVCGVLYYIARSAVESYVYKVNRDPQYYLPYYQEDSTKTFLNWKIVTKTSQMEVHQHVNLTDDCWQWIFADTPYLWKKYWPDRNAIDHNSQMQRLWRLNKKNKYLHLVYLQSAIDYALLGKIENSLNAFGMYVLQCHKSKINPKRLPSELLNSFPDPKSKKEWNEFFKTLEVTMNVSLIKKLIAAKLNPPSQKISLKRNRVESIARKHEITVAILSKVLDNINYSDSDGISTPKAPQIASRATTFSGALDALITLLWKNSSGLLITDFNALAQQHACMPNKLLDAVNERYISDAGEPILYIENNILNVIPEYRILLQPATLRDESN